jgi:magnesium transporter
MIRVYRWQHESNSGAWILPEALAKADPDLKSDKDILWIDLDCPTDEEEQLVFKEFFPIHYLSLSDITHLKRKPDVPPHFPKVEEFPDYLFVIANPLSRRLLDNITQATSENADVLFENGSLVTQMSAVLTRNVLITHHYEPVQGIDDLRTTLEKHHASAGRGPDYLFHLVLDEMIDEYAPVLDHFGEALEEHEARIFEKPSKTMLRRLIGIKRAIIVLRKSMVHEREILARLSRGEFELIDERESVYYRNVYDHILRFTELLEAAREMVGDLMQMHLAASSNRLNEVMKVLTMISTTVLPMTLVAGVYGMNFERLIPTTDTEFGFEIALILMAASGLASYLFFKWRKWI